MWFNFYIERLYACVNERLSDLTLLSPVSASFSFTSSGESEAGQCWISRAQQIYIFGHVCFFDFYSAFTTPLLAAITSYFIITIILTSVVTALFNPRTKWQSLDLSI